MGEAKPIVLSYSDMQSFLGCRQRWDFSSSQRLGWRPTERAKYLEFGLAWADAMSCFYNPDVAKLGMEPRRILTISRFVEVVEQQRKTALDYWDVLDPEQDASYEEALGLGQGMLENFFDWSEKHDTLEPIAVEREFTVPLAPGGEPMVWDGRPVHVYLRADGLVRDRRYGGLWLKEDKTAAQSNPLNFLEIDFQTQLYCWALRQLGYDVKGVIYTQAFKHQPQPPNINQDGAISVDKRQYTTARMFGRAIHDLRNRDELLYRARQAKYDAYLEYLGSEEHEARFFRRKQQPIAREAVDRLPERLYAIASDMLQNPLIYPHVTSFNCNKCHFRSVCAARQSGRDWRSELTMSGAFTHRSTLPDREDRWVATHENALASYRT